MLETIREYGTERLAGGRRGGRGHARRTRATSSTVAEAADQHLRGRRPAGVDAPADRRAGQPARRAALRRRHRRRRHRAPARRRAGLVLDAARRARRRGRPAARRRLATCPATARPDARAICLRGRRGRARPRSPASCDGLGRAAGAGPRRSTRAPGRTHPMLVLLEPLAAMLAGNEQRGVRAARSGAPSRPDPWTRATRWLLGAMLHENEGDFEEHRGVPAAGAGAATARSATGGAWPARWPRPAASQLADGDVEGSVEAYAEAHRLMAEHHRQRGRVAYTRTRLAAAYARGSATCPGPGPSWPPPRREAERTGSPIGLASVDMGLADLARDAGDRAEARRLAEGALTRSESVAGGPPQLIVMVQAFLAHAGRRRGRSRRAAGPGCGRRCRCRWPTGTCRSMAHGRARRRRAWRWHAGRLRAQRPAARRRAGPARHRGPRQHPRSTRAAQAARGRRSASDGLERRRTRTARRCRASRRWTCCAARRRRAQLVVRR